MRRPRGRRSRHFGGRVDPFLSYFILVGIGFGTWKLGLEWRLTILWLGLLVAFLLYHEARPVKAQYTLANAGWGALIGTLVSLPLLIVGWKHLYGLAGELYGTQEALSLFYRLVPVCALGEELFFRGFVQRERGIATSVLLYAGMALVYFVPGMRVPIASTAQVVLGYALLGALYSYVYARHGLSAAISSHMVVNLFIWALPPILNLLAQFG